MAYFDKYGVEFSDDRKILIKFAPDFLGEYTIPDNVIAIAPYSFRSCLGIESVIIPESVVFIGSAAFYSCSRIKTISIPKSVSNIGEEAFNGVTNIAYRGNAKGAPWGAKCINGYIENNLVYSDSTKEELLACYTDTPTLEALNAFDISCDKITIFIPESVASIAENAFNNCYIDSFHVSPHNLSFCDINGVLFSKDKTSLIRYPSHKCEESYILPETTQIIYRFAFDGFSSGLHFESITIPNSVIAIDKYAFASPFDGGIAYMGMVGYEINSVKVPYGQKERFSKMDGLKKLVDKIVEAEPPMVSHISDSLSFQSHRKKRPIIPENPLKNVTSLRAREIAEIRDTLEANDIHYFYHFTSLKNIASIKELGGLYSWYYLNQHHINIPLQGGGDLSKQLDMRSEIANYVHLSFCKNHPMSYRLIQDGEDMVVLKISTEVALLDGTMFSDMNAVDKNATRALGMVGLQNVNFEATKEEYLTSDDPLFKYKQAEVMVKTCVPSKYILNLDDF